MTTDLSGYRALVGGSSQGIGRACAQTLARQGASVTLLARSAERLQQVCDDLPRPNGQAHDYLVADFADPEQLRAVVAAHLHPDAPYHILINNTGGPAGGPITEADPAAFEAAFRQHVVANQHLVQLLLPGMRAARYGRIVNIISTSVKQPIPGLGVSNTIRAAVANWAKTLSLEVAAAGITVNNVLPGFTQTARLDSLLAAQAARSGQEVGQVRQQWQASVPIGRFATADEVAAAVAFLASPLAAAITGINLPVDGGRTASL